MTRSLLYLRAKPGRRDELVEVFWRVGVLAAASEQAGFLGAELLSRSTTTSMCS